VRHEEEEQKEENNNDREDDDYYQDNYRLRRIAVAKDHTYRNLLRYSQRCISV
jgi:hypothetical protein